jgi:hypothetical protein
LNDQDTLAALLREWTTDGVEYLGCDKRGNSAKDDLEDKKASSLYSRQKMRLLPEILMTHMKSGGTMVSKSVMRGSLGFLGFLGVNIIEDLFSSGLIRADGGYEEEENGDY